MPSSESNNQSLRDKIIETQNSVVSEITATWDLRDGTPIKVDNKIVSSLLADKLLPLVEQEANKHLKDARFNTYWGDGSPSYIDNKIKELDPSYDPVVEIDRLAKLKDSNE